MGGGVSSGDEMIFGYVMSDTIDQVAVEATPTSKPRSRGKRSTEDALATREAILDAALTLFSDRGYEGTSLRDIAASVGISHGIIRHHFGSKMMIWQTVATRVFDFFRTSLLPMADIESNGQSLDSVGAFKALVSTFIRISLNKPEYARLFVQETRQDSERADFCAEQFVELHLAIGELFSLAQAQASCLAKYTNDSFFYALMSLTYFKILHPTLGAQKVGEEEVGEKEGRCNSQENERMHDFIVSVLFDEAGV